MTDDFSFNLSEYEHELDDQPTFDDALNEMKSGNGVPSDDMLYGLSGLTHEELSQFQRVWNQKSSDYRKILMQMLVDAAEASFELDFRAIGRMTLDAEEPAVRQAAIEMLWEDERESLLERLLEMVRNDPDVSVRAEAAKAIGRFVLLGELGDLPTPWKEKCQEVLLTILTDADTHEIVYHRALESIGNCTRDDVPPIIRQAYDSDDIEMQISAIIAMGRTFDRDRWGDIVQAELTSDDDRLQQEAVHAAGELQLEAAVPQLTRLIEQEGRDIQKIALWALGEIGGDQATRYLEKAATAAEVAEDEELVEVIEEAIANANLMNGDMLLLDLDEDFLTPNE